MNKNYCQKNFDYVPINIKKEKREIGEENYSIRLCPNLYKFQNKTALMVKKSLSQNTI